MSQIRCRGFAMPSTSGPRQRRGIVPILILGIVVVLVIVGILAQQSGLGLGLPQPEPAPVQVYRPPLDKPTASPSPSLPAPTRTPMEEPGRVLTPTLMATSAPPRLAVEQSVHARYEKYFRALETKAPGLMLIPYPGDAEIDHLLAAQTSDWTIFWARDQMEGAILLRQEPFVVIVHPSWPEEKLTLEGLRALAEGRQGNHALVSPDGGQATRELLSMEQLGAQQARVDNWQAVQQHVATHPDTWGLVPWDTVTFRVRVLPVDGRWPELDNLGDYPLVRRLWLTTDIPIPETLRDDLLAALKYDPLPTVELAAVGDIMLDKTSRQMLDTHGPTWPFRGEGVQQILAGADITFGNLENPISTRGKVQPKSYTFRADPSFVQGLQYAGFDVLSLANNHIGDYGDLALIDTLDHLDAGEIVSIGAGRTITEAHEAKIIESRGLKIAFLAYNQINPKSFAATATSPGTAWTEDETHGRRGRRGPERGGYRRGVVPLGRRIPGHLGRRSAKAGPPAGGRGRRSRLGAPSTRSAGPAIRAQYVCSLQPGEFRLLSDAGRRFDRDRDPALLAGYLGRQGRGVDPRGRS